METISDCVNRVLDSITLKDLCDGTFDFTEKSCGFHSFDPQESVEISE